MTFTAGDINILIMYLGGALMALYATYFIYRNYKNKK